MPQKTYKVNAYIDSSGVKWPGYPKWYTGDDWPDVTAIYDHLKRIGFNVTKLEVVIENA